MSNHGVRILLVDDHEMMRKGLQLLLQAQPDVTVVGEASTAADALTQVRAFRLRVPPAGIEPTSTA